MSLFSIYAPISNFAVTFWARIFVLGHRSLAGLGIEGLDRFGIRFLVFRYERAGRLLGALAVWRIKFGNRGEQ